MPKITSVGRAPKRGGNMKTCPACKIFSPDSDEWCPKCGAPMILMPKPSGALSDERQAAYERAVATLAAIFLAVLVGISYFVFFRKIG